MNFLKRGKPESNRENRSHIEVPDRPCTPAGVHRHAAAGLEGDPLGLSEAGLNSRPGQPLLSLMPRFRATVVLDEVAAGGRQAPMVRFETYETAHLACLDAAASPLPHAAMSVIRTI